MSQPCIIIFLATFHEKSCPWTLKLLLYYLYINMKGKILLIALFLAFCSTPQDIVCNLNSSTVFDCSNPISTCPNATTIIIAAPDTNYQCPQSLVLFANTLNISGNYSGLDLTGS
jgi:hypothetical protein